MWQQSIENAWGLWRESLGGSVFVFVFTGVGWQVAAGRDAVVVRVVRWWLDHIVRPLFTSRSWLRRMLIIAGNNALICGAVVLLGGFGHVAIAGVICVGVGLGIALRLMLTVPVEDQDEQVDQPMLHRVLTGVGLVLNMVEVPAIMLTTGLALSQGSTGFLWLLHHSPPSLLGPVDALEIYAVVVVPMLLIGAAGEALWMTLNPKLPNFWPEP
jgi:hypothetical protein